MFTLIACLLVGWACLQLGLAWGEWSGRQYPSSVKAQNEHAAKTIRHAAESFRLVPSDTRFTAGEIAEMLDDAADRNPTK